MKDEYYYGPDSPQYPENIYTTSKAPFQLGSPQNKEQMTVSSENEILVKTTNNLDPFYYSEEEYSAYKQASAVATTTTVVTLFVAIFALFIKNSLSTIVIVSAVQICYIGLTSIDGLNPISQAMVNAKAVTGFNEVAITEKTD